MPVRVLVARWVAGDAAERLCNMPAIEMNPRKPRYNFKMDIEYLCIYNTSRANETVHILREYVKV